MTINAPAAIMLAFYVVAAERQGVVRRSSSAARSRPTSSRSTSPRRSGASRSTRRCAWSRDMIEWCAAHMPRWHPISISGLPHPRGRLDRGPGAGVHAQGRPHLRRAGGRARPRRRRLRAAAVASSSTPRSTSSRRSPSTARPGGSGRASCATRSARRTRESLADALPHPDGRRLADRPAAAQQHRPHRDRGAGRRARRHAVAAHQLLRRGARAADRGGGARSRCAPSRSSPTRPA